MEDLPSVRRLAEPADIDHVRGAGEQRHQLAAMEGGRGDDDVVEMAGAFPRVVGHIGVAWLHGLDRELADEMDDAPGHRVDVARRAGDGLGQHAAFEVEHAGRDVARLARAGREGGAHQRTGLLLDHGEQAVPHHLQANIGGRTHVTSSSTIWPRALIRALKPCGTTVVVPSSTISAGPSSDMPGPSAARSCKAALSWRPDAGSSTARWPLGGGATAFAGVPAGLGNGRSVAIDRVQVSASTSSLGMARPNTVS